MCMLLLFLNDYFCYMSRLMVSSALGINVKFSHVCGAQNYPPATPLPERSCAMLGDREASESGLRGPIPP